MLTSALLNKDIHHKVFPHSDKPCSGDAPVLAAAQEQIRTVFRQQASLSPSGPSTADAIQHAQDVAQFLRANVVQGKRIEGEKDMYRTLKHGD